jgi:hypothetical protein
MNAVKGAPISIDVVGMPEFLAGIDRVETFAAQNVISIPRASRLGQYMAVLRRLGSGRPAHRGPIDVGGAILELRQLVAIVDGLTAAPGIARMLKVLLDGHYHTIDASTHDRARDTQFELYTAARLALGGLRTELAEPDIVIELEGERVGVAAKRPRSTAGIKSAIQKAGRQVRKATARGYLAIDASMYPFPNGTVLAAFLDQVEDADRAAAQQLHRVVSDNFAVLRPRLAEEPERSGLAGILFHLAVPFTVDSERALTVVVGEAWLVLPAKLRPFRALASLMPCLGQSARVLLAGRRHVPTVRSLEVP